MPTIWISSKSKLQWRTTTVFFKVRSPLGTYSTFFVWLNWAMKVYHNTLPELNMIVSVIGKKSNTPQRRNKYFCLYKTYNLNTIRTYLICQNLFLWVPRLCKKAPKAFDLYGHACKHTKLQIHSIPKIMKMGDEHFWLCKNNRQIYYYNVFYPKE